VDGNKIYTLLIVTAAVTMLILMALHVRTGPIDSKRDGNPKVCCVAKTGFCGINK
jgi:hypothetical protein